MNNRARAAALGLRGDLGKEPFDRALRISSFEEGGVRRLRRGARARGQKGGSTKALAAIDRAVAIEPKDAYVLWLDAAISSFSRRVRRGARRYDRAIAHRRSRSFRTTSAAASRTSRLKNRDPQEPTSSAALRCCRRRLRTTSSAGSPKTPAMSTAHCATIESRRSRSRRSVWPHPSGVVALDLPRRSVRATYAPKSVS